MLARNPNIFIFPESHFFHKIRGRLADRRFPSIVSPRAASRTLDALSTSLGVEPRPDVPRWWPGIGRYARAFSRVVDQAAETRGLDLWIDKSPIHLHHIQRIRRSIPDARFLHLVRDGRDVVASLVEACERDPERWVPQLVPGGEGEFDRLSLIDAAVARWNGDLRRTIARFGDQDHHIAVYEDLLDLPQVTLAAVCEFLGVDFAPSMVRHEDAARDVVGWRENLPHMASVLQPLADRRLVNFRNLPSNEQAMIVSKLDHAGEPHAALDEAKNL